jgi:hypothetical protein
MSEESEMMNGSWAAHDESRFGEMDAMAAMHELDTLMTQYGPTGLIAYPNRHKIARAVSAMKEEDMVRWANQMTPEKNPKAFQFYMGRAKSFRTSCRSFIESQKEE